MTPLQRAAQSGPWEIVHHLLVDQPADVNVTDTEHGRTALHYAVLGGRWQVVQILVDHGADVNIADTLSGWTPLHYAAQKGHRVMVQLLLAGGADVHVMDTDCGATPLHYAARHGHPEVVQLLVDRGADVNYADDDGGMTPRPGCIWETARSESSCHFPQGVVCLCPRPALFIQAPAFWETVPFRPIRVISHRVLSVCVSLHPVCVGRTYLW